MLGKLSNEEKNIIIIDGVIEIEHWETKILIQPTYAITIHKSQGSEIDKVILVLANCDNLLNSKVAYTGVTRVKEQILLMKEDGVDEKKLYKCK